MWSGGCHGKKERNYPNLNVSSHGSEYEGLGGSVVNQPYITTHVPN